MSSHSITLFLQKRDEDGKYALVSKKPVCRDFMGWLTRVVDDTFDYLNHLDVAPCKELPKAVRDYVNVHSHNFYYIEVKELYGEMQELVSAYSDEAKSLCKSLGFTRTEVDWDEIMLGDIKGPTTLRVNAGLVQETVRKRNKAMIAVFIQGILIGCLGGTTDDMDNYRFIAAYDY
jgi:hypothetical protein